MNKKISRKVISCILAAVMLFGMTTVAFAVQEKEEINPVIVINGIDNNPLYANPGTVAATQIFPPADMTIAALTAEMYISGIVSLASNEYDEIMNFFVGSQLFQIIDQIQLNPDGTSKSSNIGPIKYNYPLSYYFTDVERYEKVAGEIGLGMVDKIGANNVYVFTYDWRIDPIVNARELDAFVQNVKMMSGSAQVSIMSEGYGSTVATTYLAECYDNATADIDNFVTVNSAFMGTSLIGDIYTGRLARNYNELQNTTSAFIRYTNDISDNPVTWFSTWLTNYILNNEWETQDLIAQCLTMMGHIVDDLYDLYLIEMLQNFTGLWALVPLEYYDEAMDLMFGGTDYNSLLQEKIQTYKNYQASAADILVKARSEGININIVSCWDLQLIPIGDNRASDEELFGLSAQSDGLIDTYYSSYGAYTIPLNDVGAAALHQQINKEGECEDHDHLSSEYDMLDPTFDLGAIAHYIDASTCALPDNTWFIRNMKHGTFDTESNSMDFLCYLITCDTTVDVYSADGLYSQFMNYNRYIKPGYFIFPDTDKKPGNYLLGDVNLDGTVNAADARLTLRISARLEDYPDVSDVVFMNADVNGDGVITAADARIILRVSAALSDFSQFKNTSDVDK